MQMKTFFAVALLALGISAASAQSAADKLDYKPAPYMFVGIQGGAQTTFTNFDQLKLITPTASVSFGAFFTPAVGARLHVNGMWNKGGIENEGADNFTYKYKYVTTDVDLLLNLCTLFGRQNYYPVNVYLIGGIGLDYAWNNDDLMASDYKLPFAWEKDRLSHNVRVGAMLDYNFSKHFSLNLEVSANSLSDRFNSKTNNSDDWQLTAQLGLAYKFGFKKKVVAAPVVVAPVEEYVEEKVAEVVPVAPAVEAKPKVLESTKKDVFFLIASSDIRDSESAKIKEVIQWMNSHPTAKAIVTGHADAGTGNPTLNARYAEDRAKTVAKALVDGGVDAARITVDSKGDTVMPYGDTEKSRVAIIVAKEQ